MYQDLIYYIRGCILLVLDERSLWAKILILSSISIYQY